MRIPTRIPTTAQQRAQEAAWIAACHADWGLVLMELAGRRAAEVAFSMWQQNRGPVTVVCGRGNNGGDGMVVARYLALCGVPVTVYAVQDSPSNDNAINRGIFEQLGSEVVPVDAACLDPFNAALSRSSLVVDALLGTGLDRPVAGVYRSLIEAINASGASVLSLDLPSGVHSDTGQVMGVAVRAHATVTFGYLKAGLLNYPGAELCGALYLGDIGLPALEHHLASLADKSEWWLTTADFVRSLLPGRPADAHKGTFGHVLTIAGSLGMSGAAFLAGKTALRSGAGLCILATARSLVPHLPAQELVYRALDDTADGTISVAAIAQLEPELERATAVILGPGISLNPETVEFMHHMVGRIEQPCLVDADGLNAISVRPDTWPGEAGNFVITPHPKELSRLTGMPVADIQANRIEAAQKASARFGCTVVLKGARTIIANREQHVFINPTGNSGMATGGSGDVLSGIVGGLMAQGVPPFQAAVAGAYIHGAAGDLAAAEIGETGIVAGDIATFVPITIARLRAGDYGGSSLEAQLLGFLRER